MRSIPARNSQTSCPKRFCATFANTFSPVKITKTFFRYELQKKGLHMFFCNHWAPFFEIKQRWGVFLLGFSGILPKFSRILTKFSRILHGFLINQNFWGCACPPAPSPPTPLVKIKNYLSLQLRAAFTKVIQNGNIVRTDSIPFASAYLRKAGFSTPLLTKSNCRNKLENAKKICWTCLWGTTADSSLALNEIALN